MNYKAIEYAEACTDLTDVYKQLRSIQLSHDVLQEYYMGTACDQLSSILIQLKERVLDAVINEEMKRSN